MAKISSLAFKITADPNQALREMNRVASEVDRLAQQTRRANQTAASGALPRATRLPTWLSNPDAGFAAGGSAATGGGGGGINPLLLKSVGKLTGLGGEAKALSMLGGGLGLGEVGALAGPALAAAAVAAFGAAVLDTSRKTGELRRESEALGVSVAAYDAMQRAAEQAGASVSVLAEAQRGLTARGGGDLQQAAQQMAAIVDPARRAEEEVKRFGKTSAELDRALQKLAGEKSPLDGLVADDVARGAEVWDGFWRSLSSGWQRVKAETAAGVGALLGGGGHVASITEAQAEAAKKKADQQAELNRLMEEYATKARQAAMSEEEIAVAKARQLGASARDVAKIEAAQQKVQRAGEDREAQQQQAQAAEQRVSLLEQAADALQRQRDGEEAVAEAKLRALGATEAEVAQYRQLAAETKRLKEQEEARDKARRDSEQALAKQKSEAETLTEQTRTPGEKARDELRRIKGLYDAGLISGQTALRGGRSALESLVSDNVSGAPSALERGSVADYKATLADKGRDARTAQIKAIDVLLRRWLPELGKASNKNTEVIGAPA